MKKSKLITGLSAAFVSAMALMSCSSLVKAKSGVILTIDGVPYTAEDLFNDQKTPAAAEAKFNAVYKVAVRAYFKTHTDDNKEIERQVKVKMNEQKATAKSNADKNGTSYDVEWKKILKENGVDTTKKLQDKFEYEFQKEKFEDNFYEEKDEDGKTNYDKLRSGILEGADPKYFTNYFEGKQPYHMKHILVKVDGIGSDNETGTITKEQARKLYNVITQLAAGTSFEKVSEHYNDDETAQKEYGSLGIMSRDTSFVDDFKLGTYLYEAFRSKATSTEDEQYKTLIAKDKFFGKLEQGQSYEPGTAGDYATKIIDEVKDQTSNDALGVIPFEAALALGYEQDKEFYPTGGYGDCEYDKLTKLNDAGIDKSDFKDKYLPRNVIFNKYFNKHNIMVIAPAKMSDGTFTYGNTGDTGDIVPNGSGSIRKKEDGKIGTYNSDYVTKTTEGELVFPGFSKDPKNGDDLVGISSTLSALITDSQSKQHVLRDNSGRLILVFRSGTGSSSNDDSGYQGIHFVVIERSPFVQKEFDGAGDNYYTTNDEYYTVYYPGQPGGKHPQYTGTTEDKHTYANYIMNDPELKNKKDRADKVKTELKNCMPNLNTFIYDYLLKKSGVEFSDTPEAQAVKDCITNWIEVTREDAKFEKERTWNNNWQNYYYSLKAKNETRKETVIGTAPDNIERVDSLLVPQYCIYALTSDIDEINLDAVAHMFGVGGVFHD